MMSIRAGHRSNTITSLSGGNQQKVVIARWLATSPRSCCSTTRRAASTSGTKSDIYQVLTEAAADGVAVVMLSTELIELVELMDRVLVFREGELFRELPREQLREPAWWPATSGTECGRMQRRLCRPRAQRPAAFAVVLRSR